jgi:hypothetical protein
MKKAFYILAALVLALTAYAQEEEDFYDKTLMQEFEEQFNIYFVYSNGAGDNALARANDGKGGFGASMSFFTMYRAYLNVGVEYNHYTVSNHALASNAESTNIFKLYLELMYKYHISRKVSINPEASIGFANLSQKRDSNNYGDQGGVVYTLGFNIDYRLEAIGFFAGVNYAMIKANVNTVPEYEDFYSKLNSVNIIVGIKF